MSRITKVIATDVAKKMSKPAMEQRKKAQDLLREAVYVIMIKRTPKILKEAFEKYPNYFTTSSCVKFAGNGFNHEILWTSEKFIKPEGSYGNTIIEPTDAEAKIVKPLYEDFKKKQGDYTSLANKIEVTLNNLKTYNKVKTDFPEAFDFLPPKNSTALAIPIEDIRKQLETYEKI